MTNPKTNQDPNISLDSKKFPKWLRPGTGQIPGGYPMTEKIARLLELDGDGTARDTATGKPSQKAVTYKKVRRRIAEMEELHEWIRKKKCIGKVDSFLDTLEGTLNDMIEP